MATTWLKTASPTCWSKLQARVEGTQAFGALGKAIGDRLQAPGRRCLTSAGIEQASLEELKALCASLATYGGTALFHMQGVTPEAGQVSAAR